MKLTGWYRGDQKPVRVGVYERDWGDGIDIPSYAYWNGKIWKCGDACIEGAIIYKNGVRSIKQDIPWRGVAK